jgi:basic membrane lipoprotein Med (substrate-binding protein (PBP1-ABC) superfamily)
MKNKIKTILNEFIGEDRDLGKNESFVAVEINAYNIVKAEMRAKVDEISEKLIKRATRRIPCANCGELTGFRQTDFDLNKDEDDIYCSEQCRYNAETGCPGEEY